MLTLTAALALAFISPPLVHQASPGPYHVLQTATVGGEGGFDYVYADSQGRKLYVARTGPTPRVAVYNLDSLQSAGKMSQISAHGAVVDSKFHHALPQVSPWRCGTRVHYLPSKQST